MFARNIMSSNFDGSEVTTIANSSIITPGMLSQTVIDFQLWHRVSYQLGGKIQAPPIITTVIV